MEKVLSQGEIDALFRAAHGESTEDPATSLIEAWDLHQAGLLGKEQLNSVSRLHESFARNLAAIVGSYLHGKFEVALVAVEQLAYRDFLARFSDDTYYSTFGLHPGDARGILHVDLSLVFPMVDLMLGGPGDMPANTREVTAIEASLLEGVGVLLCQELQKVWEPIGLQVEFEKMQPIAQMLRIMPPEERTLTLTFDVTVSAFKGMLNIAFPSSVSSALMRKLRAETVYQRARRPAVNQRSIGNRLLQSTVRMELMTPAVTLRAGQLLALQSGEVLPLRRRIEEPVTLRIGGRDCWNARPVSSGNCRAAQLLQPLVQPENQE